MAVLTILVMVALLAALVAVVTSVLGISIAVRRQDQRLADPKVGDPSAIPAGPAGAHGPAGHRALPSVRPGRASARLFLAVVAIAAAGAALITLGVRFVGGLIQRLLS